MNLPWRFWSPGLSHVSVCSYEAYEYRTPRHDNVIIGLSTIDDIFAAVVFCNGSIIANGKVHCQLSNQCKKQVQQKIIYRGQPYNHIILPSSLTSICLQNCMMLAWDNPEEQKRNPTLTYVPKHWIAELNPYKILAKSPKVNDDFFFPSFIIGCLYFSFFYCLHC